MCKNISDKEERVPRYLCIAEAEISLTSRFVRDTRVLNRLSSDRTQRLEDRKVAIARV